MAASAASFPYLGEKAREKMVQTLEDQATVTKREEADSTTGDLERLRTWAQIDAIKQGLPVRLRGAGKGAQEPVVAPEATPEGLSES